MLSAKDAYKKTERIHKHYSDCEISEILSSIDEAAENGGYGLICKIDSQEILTTLKELGYKVTGLLFGFYAISWKNPREDKNGKDK